MDYRPKTIQLIEKSIGVNLCDLRLGNAFLDITKSQARKSNINWTLSKLLKLNAERISQKSEKIIQKMKKILESHIPDKCF